MSNTPSSSRIVMCTFGSLGDLHPFLAIGCELKKRHYDVIIATSPVYKEKTENLGLGFHPVRPDIDLEDQHFIQQVTNHKRGPEFLIREHVMPYLLQSYEDLEALLKPDDSIITHPLAYAAHALAEKLGLTWTSATLSPTWYFSVHDAPVLTKFPQLKTIQNLSPSINRAIFGLGNFITRSWTKPLIQFRKRLGLSTDRNSVMEGFISPHRDLALFSSTFAKPQPDWPDQTVATGFPFFDYPEEDWDGKNFQDFLDAGPAPVVFTLGSAVVKNPGPFFEISIDVVKRIGCRAILLMEEETREKVAEAFNPDQILIKTYIPYSALFQHARVIVHQCGIGTTAQALASGHPSLAVPYSNDQPDNAHRLEQLGVARHLNIRNFSQRNLQRELTALMENPSYEQQAQSIARQIQKENGVKRACQEIEKNVEDRTATFAH